MAVSLHSSLIARWASSDSSAHLRLLTGLVLSMLPAILASLTLPPIACIFAVIISVALCYRTSAAVQPKLFAMSLRRANALIAMPLQIIFSAWALLLLTLDRPGQVGASLFCLLIVTFTAIAPLLRRARSKRTRRRFPYPLTFGAAAVVVLAIQLYCRWVTL